jgi:hypothetical protein
MRLPLTSLILLGSVLSAPLVVAGQDQPTEIELLRQELKQMRSDYEVRIRNLETRLDVAEQRAQKKAVEPVSSPAANSSVEPPTAPVIVVADRSKSNAFNPALGVILQGQAWSYGQDPHDYAIPGFPLGGEAHLAPEGLGLGETEINISANVDDLFTAWLTLPVVIEDGETAVELEEAWVETLALPGGLSARFGRFFSNIGYLNEKHAHSWDFVDQPLAYKALLGKQYIDDGIQLRWLAPTDLYLQLGAEVLRGDRYPAAGAGNSGFGSYTLKAVTGGDLGYSHSWQAGLSYLDATADERESGDEHEPLLFTGDVSLMIADFVWKWAPDGNWRQRNFKVQAEYLWRSEDGVYALPGGSGLPWNVDQEGWYLQAVYQPFPQWRLGARLDGLSSDDPGMSFDGTALEPGNDDPMRYSLMLDWSHSEFSRLRLQYTRDQAGLEDENQFGLQYTHSIGAHGAHSF